MSNNDGWIEWVWSEEKPYPDLYDDLNIDVMMHDGVIDASGQTVKFWRNEPNSFDPSNYLAEIVGVIKCYKLAEEN